MKSLAAWRDIALVLLLEWLTIAALAWIYTHP
jgi:hypothetical protein